MGESIPEFKIKNPDKSSHRGKVYTRAELCLLLRHCRRRGKHTRLSNDLRLQVYMAYSTGMRKGEILNFKYEYIDKRGWVYIPPCDMKTKQKEDRMFPLSKTLLRIIHARHKKSKYKKYLFESQLGKPPKTNNMSWRRLRKRSGVQGRFHDLRHTHATWLLQLIPAKFVVKLLGMTEEVLNRYVHVPQEVAEKAINQVVQVEKGYKKAA